MPTFFSELGLVLAVVAVLGAAGWFILAPFRAALPFVLLGCPFAGLLAVVSGTSALYTIAGFTVARSAGISLACCLALTLYTILIRRMWPAAKQWQVRESFGGRSSPSPAAPGEGRLAGANEFRPPKRSRAWQWVWTILAALLVPIVLTLTADAVTIHLGGPGLLYSDGTDHLGYAQLADWLCTHPLSEPPVASARVPYDAFPDLIFRIDPRFGSYFSLAILESVCRRSGAFTYDIACAIVLSAGILAVGAVFSRTPLTLLLLLAGLIISHWFDYSRGGYFGKVIGYPGALFVLGLFFATTDVRSPGMLCLLAALSGAVAIMHSGLATGLFLAAVIAPYLLMLRVRHLGDDPQQAWHRAGAALLLIAVAVLSTGLLARPGHTAPPDWRLSWDYILPRILDLENQGTTLSSLSAGWLMPLAVVGLLTWALLIAIASVVREPVAFGLLLGPLLLTAAFAAAGARAEAFQLIGILYPFGMCGAARLIGQLQLAKWQPAGPSAGWLAAAIALTLVALGLRVPRYQGAVRRYALSDSLTFAQYSRRQTRHLVGAIRSQTVDVDISSPNPAIFVLTEIGRRGTKLQWTPRAWETVFSFTHWPPPTYSRPGRLRLVLSTDPVPQGYRLKTQTTQYRLLERLPAESRPTPFSSGDPGGRGSCRAETRRETRPPDRAGRV